MLLGIIFHNYIGYVAFLSKYIIFVMLLITYTRLKISDFHIGAYIWWLLAAQILGAVGAYFLIKPLCIVGNQAQRGLHNLSRRTVIDVQKHSSDIWI